MSRRDDCTIAGPAGPAGPAGADGAQGPAGAAAESSGSFAAILQPQGGAITATGGGASDGRWYKLGHLVWLSARVMVTSVVSPTGWLEVRGMAAGAPAPPINLEATCAVYMVGLVAGTTVPIAQISIGDNPLKVRINGLGEDGVETNIAARVKAGTICWITAVWQVA